jgi:outer membrane protein assembly factor BamB
MRIDALLTTLLFFGIVFTGCDPGRQKIVLPEPDMISRCDSGCILEVKWKFKGKGAMRSMPLIVDDSVYIGTTKGTFYRIDLQTGEELWSIKTSGAIDHEALEYGDCIVFMTGPEEEALYCVDRKGTVVKKTKIGDPSCAPLYCGGSVVVATVSGMVTGVDPVEGTRLWERWYSGRINNVAGCIEGERLYISTIEKDLYCVNGPEMDVLWRSSTERVIAPSFFVDLPHNQLLFVDYGGALHSVDLQSGIIRWKRDMTRFNSPFFVGNDHLYLTTYDRELHILSTVKGEPSASVPVEGLFRICPFLYEGNICLVSRKGYLAVIDHDGLCTAAGKTAEITRALPAVSKRWILLGSDSGYLFALAPSSNAE